MRWKAALTLRIFLKENRGYQKLRMCSKKIKINGGMQMKKVTLKVTKALSEMAMAYTKININSVCLGRLGQPKMPKGFEKLRNKE